jgi:glycosyltransferase involved in cell wall biosynthesis
LENCLNSVLPESPGEIIIIDGGSTDGSVELGLKHNLPVYYDGGGGIAGARHMGVVKSKMPYILFVGPDNILPAGFIREMKKAMEDWGFVAAAPQTRVRDPITFWDKGLDFRLLVMENHAGPTDVIGTPTLYKREIFEKIKYNELAGACDDTDICMQMRREKFLFGIVPVMVYDQNGLTRQEILTKFKLYGSGDWAFYRLYKDRWSLGRRLLSLTHPLRQTFRLSLLSIVKFMPELLVWFFFTMFSRYYGWFSASMKNWRLKK